MKKEIEISNIAAVISVLILLLIISLVSTYEVAAKEFTYNVFIPYDMNNEGQKTPIFIDVSNFELDINEIIEILAISDKSIEISNYGFNPGGNFLRLYFKNIREKNVNIEGFIIKTNNNSLTLVVKGKIIIKGIKNKDNDLITSRGISMDMKEIILKYENRTDEVIELIELNMGNSFENIQIFDNKTQKWYTQKPKKLKPGEIVKYKISNHNLIANNSELYYIEPILEYKYNENIYSCTSYSISNLNNFINPEV